MAARIMHAVPPNLILIIPMASALPKAPKIRLAGFYLIYFAILGSFMPYWPLYLKNLGFNADGIGWLMAIPPAARIISPGFWGWLADRSGKTLSLIRWISFFAMLGFLAFSGRNSLTELILITSIFSLFWSGLMPLFETLTLDHLYLQTSAYSRIRLWGSIGFIAAVGAVGYALDHLLPVIILPCIISALLLCEWLFSLTLPNSPHIHHPEKSGALLEIIKKREVAGLLAASFLLQVSHGPYYSFYSVFLESFGYTRSQTGQLWALGVIAEIFMFISIPRLVHGSSLRIILLMSIGLSAVRWLMIAFSTGNLAVLIGAQILHAASFGSAHAVTIHFIHRYFRGQHHAKGQALNGSLSFGLGGALGSLAAGQYWNWLGAEWVFGLAGVVSLAGLLVAWLWVDKNPAKDSPRSQNRQK